MSGLARFWDHVRDQSWCQRHPASADPARLAFTVPVALFGDDCKIYKEEKITVWQCSFVLSPESTLQTTFVIGVLPGWCTLKDKSYRSGRFKTPVSSNPG